MSATLSYVSPTITVPISIPMRLRVVFQNLNLILLLKKKYDQETHIKNKTLINPCMGTEFNVDLTVKNNLICPSAAL